MNNSNDSRRHRGQRAEALALAYLERRRLRLVCKNYRSRFGEIDLIMDDAENIVFVEVRYRNHDGRLHPAETIDERKQDKLIRTGHSFVQRHQARYPRHDYRFDVIAVTGAIGRPRIDWIQNAFSA